SYRDELAAAHARIAALEQELAARPGGATWDARVAQRQAARDKAALAASPRNALRVGLLLTVVFATLFMVPALMIRAYGLAALAAVLGAALGLFVGRTQVRAGADLLKKAQEELDDVLRLQAVERQVAETRMLLERAQESGAKGLRAPSLESEPEDEGELEA